MMSENESINPFAGLFSTINDANSFSPSVSSNDHEQQPGCQADDSASCNANAEKPAKKDLSPEETLLREVFGITLDSEYRGRNNSNERIIFVNADSAEDAIFQRLFLTIDDTTTVSLPKKEGTVDSPSCDLDSVQLNIMTFLFVGFCRSIDYTRKTEFQEQAEKLRLLALRNAATVLQEPDLFPGHKIDQELASLIVDYESSSCELSSFLAGIIGEMSLEDVEGGNEEMVLGKFELVLDGIRAEARNHALMPLPRSWFQILRIFASIQVLAKLVIRHSTPKDRNNGRAYSDTMLGSLFSLSCLPNSPDAPFQFFEKPLESTRSRVEGYIWMAVDDLTESLHSVFHSLLKCSPEVRNLTLGWIGNCLAANASRGKLWNAQNEIAMGGAVPSSVSDGFMINLGTVLLRLCQPFCGNFNEPKVLKIDPTYCATEAKNEEERDKRGLHMRGMSSETCLVPTPEGETREHAESFGFVTECFFLTHRSLDLGYRVILEKLLRTNQDVARMQRLYNETRNAEQGNSSLLDVIAQRMELEMTKYLSLRASVLAPGILGLLAKFHAATAFWLIQVNLDVEDEETSSSGGLNRKRSSYAPSKLVTVTFPLLDKVPKTVRCIPEFVVENTVDFLCFLKRLSPETFEEQDPDFLNPILTEIIALMESPKRLYNPHLRARLAEGLEALLPTDEKSANQGQLGTCLHRAALFVKHPHRRQIVASLLQVFVSIEMTGQSVQFEQKFNYRRPMYVVMDYLWKLDEHQRQFKSLAEEAELNMEAVQPPLFLRFVNLLMNDAVFLLDEALSNMAQIKQMHNARESGEWNKLPQQERDQQASSLQHIGMIARFDNILGRETINMLKMLTTEIKSIFCHPTMVDRIASMLNYLLLQLVGPNKRNLKVKDQKEYDFNPANLVLNICEIYINLSHNENFTLAVSQDGRSYSPQLFKLAENVLVRIGGVGILGDLDNLSKRVEEAGHVKKEEDEILNNAPDDFLDPIMSTLMADPVVLPSSKITVDRQTIARHLLSDQTDPFNRSPLTMDMIQSNTELRSQIQEWIRQKKEEKSAMTAHET